MQKINAFPDSLQRVACGARTIGDCTLRFGIVLQALRLPLWGIAGRVSRRRVKLRTSTHFNSQLTQQQDFALFNRLNATRSNRERLNRSATLFNVLCKSPFSTKILSVLNRMALSSARFKFELNSKGFRWAAHWMAHSDASSAALAIVLIAW